MAEERTRLFMQKDGVMKELLVEELSDEVVSALDEAYKHSKVVGISRRMYKDMVRTVSPQLVAYSRELINVGEPTNRHRLFADCFDINSASCPLLYSALLWIDISAEEKNFTSRSINIGSVRTFLTNYRAERCSYARMQREYKEECAGLFGNGVGFIKLLKFYYSLITCPNFAMATA